MRGKSTHVSAGFCISLSLLLLLVPFSWLTAMLFAAFTHELFHLIAIRIFSKENAMDIRLLLSGARIQMPELSEHQELLCSLAGPIGGCILLIFIDIFPKLAICGVVQSIYNLLPLYPLDGGRALRCFLSMVTAPPMAERIFAIVSRSCKIILLLIGVLSCFWKGIGPIGLLVCILAIIRVK